jgi:hypothetical protein
VYFLAYQELFSLRPPGNFTPEPHPQAERELPYLFHLPETFSCTAIEQSLHRLIPDKELDRIVTGECFILHTTGIKCLIQPQPNCFPFTVAKA